MFLIFLLLVLFCRLQSEVEVLASLEGTIAEDFDFAALCFDKTDSFFFAGGVFTTFFDLAFFFSFFPLTFFFTD